MRMALAGRLFFHTASSDDWRPHMIARIGCTRRVGEAGAGATVGGLALKWRHRLIK
jgi:hypothetical protein